MKAQEQKLEEKIVLTFNSQQDEDNKIIKEIEDCFKFINSLPFGKQMTKSEFLKKFFRKPTESDMIKVQKLNITHDQKINLWVNSHNKMTNSNISKDEFIVKVLPTLSKRAINNLEKTNGLIQ